MSMRFSTWNTANADLAIRYICSRVLDIPDVEALLGTPWVDIVGYLHGNPIPRPTFILIFETAERNPATLERLLIRLGRPAAAWYISSQPQPTNVPPPASPNSPVTFGGGKQVPIPKKGKGGGGQGGGQGGKSGKGKKAKPKKPVPPASSPAPTP
jgi:hypothetical protein